LLFKLPNLEYLELHLH